MWATRIAISRPVAILMLIGAFVVIGLVGFSQLPAELNPQVDFPTITVNTTYTGTNPLEMETLITKPIENAISGVSGIQEIDSTSEQGVSNVRIQFYFGTNIDTADSDVIQKVDSILSQLPTGANSPSVIKADTTGQPIMNIGMSSPQRSEQYLQSLALNVVQPQLEQATGVGQVNINTGSQREIHVDIPVAKLAAYGVTVTQIAQAIYNANVNVSSGFIQSGNQYYNVRLVGEFASVDEIKNLRITVNQGGGSSSSSGLPTTAGGLKSAQMNLAGSGTSSSSTSNAVSFNLSDVATVTDTGSEKVYDTFLNGNQVVGMNILLSTGGNTVQAVNSVKQQLQYLKKIVPSDVKFVVSRDQSLIVASNLQDVVSSLVLGAILAILVVFIFLHNIRGTIIIAIAIPTSMISTFFPLWVLGFTLNTMSLLGLSLAVGILVDDSIVVLENINRHLSLGEEPTDAAINGRTEIGLAAITLTTVDLVVFLPIAFMGGVIGEFFRSFGITVAFATLFSLLVSFTLTPMLAARWYQKGEKLEYDTGFAGSFDRGFKKFEKTYQNVLRSCLRRPWTVVIVSNLILLVVFYFIGRNLGFRFSPDQDQGLVNIFVQAPAGSSLAYTENIVNQVEQIVWHTPDLNTDTQYLAATIGNGGPGTNVTGTQYAYVNLTLYDKKSVLDDLQFWNHEHLRTRSDVDVAQELQKLVKGIPGALIQPANVSGFGGGGAPLQINLTGPDFNQLLAAEQQVYNLVKAAPGAYSVDVSYKNAQPEVDVRLDRTKAAFYGQSLNTIAAALSDSIAGNITSEYRDPVDGQQYYIRVELTPGNRSDPNAISQVIVGYQNGSPVLLGDVANISVSEGPVKIDRLNREREIYVSAFLRPGFPVGNVALALNQQMAKMNFGQVTYSFGGETQSIQREFPYLISAFLLGIILTYMLMAALFNNMLYPLSIMLSLPQAWCGAMIALWIVKEPVSLIAMIGVVLLNAIVNKNAILLVDYTNTLRARGYKRTDALLEAAPTRLRPIMMTTFTIMVSSIPTALALGRGAGFRQPVGITVLGGISLSLFLTLLVIPAAYLLYDNFTNWIGKIVYRRQIPIEAFEPSPTSSRHNGQGELHDGHGGGAESGNGASRADEPLGEADQDEAVPE